MDRSPDTYEAAAIAAAIRRFITETTPVGAGQGNAVSPWQRAALLEGVGAKASIVDLEGEGGSRWLS